MEITHPEVPPQPPKSYHYSREIWGWAIYDFANTIFSMNILTLYFAGWVILDHGLEDIWYSVTFSASMLLVALTNLRCPRHQEKKSLHSDCRLCSGNLSDWGHCQASHQRQAGNHPGSIGICRGQLLF